MSISFEVVHPKGCMRAKGARLPPFCALRQDIELGRGLWLAVCSSDQYTTATHARALITSRTPRVPSGLCRREGEGLPAEPGRWESWGYEGGMSTALQPLPWQPREKQAKEAVFSVSLTKTLVWPGSFPLLVSEWGLRSSTAGVQVPARRLTCCAALGK